MFGLLGRLGRSRELRHLDDELRIAGVHPATVTDAVKLTVIRLLKTGHGAAGPHFAETAGLVAYCILGPGPFSDTNGPGPTEAVEHRLHAAIANGSSLDAQIVLLTMHANIIRSEVIERFGLNIDA